MPKRAQLFVTIALVIYGLPAMAADAHDLSRGMGRIAGYCIIGVAVIAIGRKMMGKKGS